MINVLYCTVVYLQGAIRREEFLVRLDLIGGVLGLVDEVVNVMRLR
jgi:hypothetical protein